MSLPFTVRFIAFGSEELGLKGSLHYLASLDEAQQSRIKAMFNFDALGSGRQMGILGDAELTQFLAELGGDEGIDLRVSAGLFGAGSDHMSFSSVGIPVIMFSADDFSRLHTPRDTLEFVEPSLLGDAAALAIALIESKDFWLNISG